MKLMTQVSLSYLQALAEEGAGNWIRPMALRDKYKLRIANTTLAMLEREGLAKKRPNDRIYTITPKGAKMILTQLDLAPFDEHPVGGSSNSSEEKKAYREKKKNKKEAQQMVLPEPEPEAPNLSSNANELFTGITNLMQENAALRDAMQTMYDQLGVLLYGTDTTESENNSQSGS